MILVGSEHFGDLSDFALDFLLLFSVFLELGLVGHQVHLVDFLLIAHAHLLAHEGAEARLERGEVDVALALGVQHRVHERLELGIAVLDLQASHVRGEIVVRDEAVAILIHGGEALVVLWLRFKAFVFEVNHDVSEASDRDLFGSFTERPSDSGGRRVSTHAIVDHTSQRVGVFLVNERRNLGDVSATVLVVSKRRQETLDFFLVYVTGNQILTALLHNEALKIVFVQVAVLVAPSLLKRGLEIVTGLEFALKGTVHFDEVLLHSFSQVLRYALTIEDFVIVKDALARLGTGQAVSARADAGGRSGEQTLVRLLVVIEGGKVLGHVLVVDLAGLLVLEAEQVVVEHVVVLLYLLRNGYSRLYNFQESVGVSHVGLLFIVAHQVGQDVPQLILDAVSPMVARTELHKLFLTERREVKLFLAIELAQLLSGS